jgi:hypothetical protein
MIRRVAGHKKPPTPAEAARSQAGAATDLEDELVRAQFAGAAGDPFDARGVARKLAAKWTGKSRRHL